MVVFPTHALGSSRLQVLAHFIASAHYFHRCHAGIRLARDGVFVVGSSSFRVIIFDASAQESLGGVVGASAVVCFSALANGRHGKIIFIQSISCTSLYFAGSVQHIGRGRPEI